jgi:hypothetical protein
MALFGIQVPAAAINHQGGDVDGQPGNELAPGEVFKFQTITKNGIEAAGKYSQLLCHSQAFIDPKDFTVRAIEDSSTLGGFGVGEMPGTGLGTATDWFARPLAITTNENDLWNSGVVMDNGSPQQPVQPLQSNCGPGDFGCRWSNADGQNQVMSAIANDDSGRPAGSQIGFVHGDHTQNSLTLPVGRLVGKLGSTFFDIGVAKNFNAPPGGGGNNLTLFYHDLNSRDNQGEIKVRVATNSIQCKAIVNDQLVFVSAQGNIRGERRVEVEGFPTLNVDNKSKTANFPFAVLGCNTGDAEITFGPNGSPIVVGKTVLVNNKLVDIKGFTVANKVSRPSCDGGAALPDLQLQLNRLQVINALVPNGVCQNGPFSYSVTLGPTPNGPFYGGQDTVELTNCD